jgi:hypothetical protein
VINTSLSVDILWKRWKRLCVCALVVELAGGCAPRSSPQVLEALHRIRTHRQADSAEADVNSWLLSVMDFVHLAEATTGDEHELVNGAYAKCLEADTRAKVVALAAYRHTGRYVPLLCYAAQFDPAPEVRLDAARGLSATKEIEPPLSRSVVVSILGKLMENAENACYRDQLAHWLDTFLLKTCHYAIPGAERREALLAVAPCSKVRLRVEQADPAVVLDWWQTTGRQMALSGGFD